MSLATRATATSLRLLTQYGEAVTVARASAGVYDPTTGVTTTTPTAYSGVGYPSNYMAANIDGDIIRQSDIYLILSSTTLPLVNDVMTVRSKEYTALDVQRISVSGTDVLYKIQLRQ